MIKLHFEQVQGIAPIMVTQIPDPATPVRILENGRPTFIHDKPNHLSLTKEDQELIEASDKKYVAFTRFLYGIYAHRLGIKPISLILDEEIMKFEQEMSDYDLTRHQQILEDAITAYNRLKDSK